MKACYFFLLLLVSSLLMSCDESESYESSSYVNTGEVVDYGCDYLDVAGKISKSIYNEGLYPTEYGIVYSPDRNSLDVGDDGSLTIEKTNTYGALTDFQIKIEGLLPNKTYYYRAYIYIAGIYYYGPTRSANTKDLKFSNVNIEYQRLRNYVSNYGNGYRLYTYHFSCDLSETVTYSLDLDYNGVGSDLRTLHDYLITQGKKVDDDFEIYFDEWDYTYDSKSKTYSTKGMVVNISVCLQDRFNEYALVPVYSFQVVLPE